MIVFQVSGKRRVIDPALWDELRGPKPPENFESNGCTMSTDRYGRVQLWPACVIHDWHYESGCLGKDWSGRRLADLIFYQNTMICCRMQGLGPVRSQWIAAMRWRAVRLLGARRYAFASAEVPQGTLQELQEEIGVFRAHHK